MTGNRRLKRWLIALMVIAVALTQAAVGGFTAYAQAETAKPKLEQPQAGYYRMKVGMVDVIALSDGTLPIKPDNLYAKPDHVKKLLRASRVSAPLDASVNAFLIIKDDRLILVDAGTGELYGPTLNKLTASLASVGYKPEQITDILITHIHTDHTGGLSIKGKLVFPNATVHVERIEAEFWLDPANKEKAKKHHKRLFDEARANFLPCVEAGKVRTFDGATELFPGIASLPARGHTPGHTFYVLSSGREKLVFWGDLLHIAEVQFPDPSVTIEYDSDPAAAAAQRKLAFAAAAKEEYLVAAAHIYFPGVGRVVKAGAGYRFIPVPYVNDAFTPAK